MKIPFLIISALVGAQAEVIREDFNSMDDLQSHWDISQWAATGPTITDTIKAYKAENVQVDQGQLVLKLNASPPGTYPRCGEVTFTPRKFLYGSFRASIKTTNIPGSVIGWFVYKDGVPGDGNLHEVDFEILTRQAQKMWFTLHHDAYSVDSKSYTVSFNPWEAFHEYRYDWYKDSVSYFIDGVQVGKLTKKVPDDSTQLMLNHWSSNLASWGGAAPLQDTYMYVDYVEYRSLDELNANTPILRDTKPFVIENHHLYWKGQSSTEPMLLNAQGQILYSQKGATEDGIDLEPWQGQKLYLRLSEKHGDKIIPLP